MAVSVQVIGRLGANAELRTSKNGKSFISFRMATDEFKNGATETAWLNVADYTDRAQKIVQFLTKGRHIAIYGIETVSIYTDKNGQPQISRDIVSDRVEFVNSGSQNGEQSNKQSYANEQREDVKSKSSDLPPINCGTLHKPEVSASISSVSQDSDDDLPF